METRYIGEISERMYSLQVNSKHDFLKVAFGTTQD